jgi:hypothetical protein
MNENKVREVVIKHDTSTIFVTSKATGLGKTKYIKSLGKSKTLILFPIAGTLDLKEIGERLSLLDVSKPSVLAI